jgi:MSHA biogenesis protein MshN
LQKNLPDAKDQADYQAFMAVLMQRQNRHQEAIVFFQAALQLVPNNGVWLMGMGISLQAMQRNEEAKEVYTRALTSNSLNAQLQAFVQKKLKEL